MQASTSEQFVISVLLEDALTRALVKAGLTDEEVDRLGFQKDLTIADRILSFQGIQESVMKAAEVVAPFTDIESDVYRNKKHSFYFA